MRIRLHCYESAVVIKIKNVSFVLTIDRQKLIRYFLMCQTGYEIVSRKSISIYLLVTVSLNIYQIDSLANQIYPTSHEIVSRSLKM